ncbi:predicted protein [Verticillium alfalfae VaMs.102]|uniref:Predicted protein n=1 Tax=Verticillium alfalfae (strain VaMs.102 / ATCC MYA-4576 / FGSC 10136) TaxID=526221 RepID=C9SEP5_VERA1|nr:predicted protein [Verticillium alfalfae VaMs.102]EEY16638.1 predicted protein [Verticillium alfalfae VaMs.102]
MIHQGDNILYTRIESKPSVGGESMARIPYEGDSAGKTPGFCRSDTFSKVIHPRDESWVLCVACDIIGRIECILAAHSLQKVEPETPYDGADPGVDTISTND